jgi:hypothetical protein
MTDPLEELDGFIIQDDGRTAYLRAVCRHCSTSWYVPRDPQRRARGALGVLCEHVEQHGDYDGAADFERSLSECYSEVRARKAAGGPGWPAEEKTPSKVSER